MSSPSHFRPLELRLAPEFRRCAVYVVAGAGVASGFVVGTKLADLNPRSWGEIAAMVGVFAVGATGLLTVTFRYRLRIDARGVWRRRLLRWDLWPWQAFEGGHVRHGRLGDEVTYPEKSWYWRTISASLLGEASREAFEAAVALFRILPPPPELPDVLMVKYGLRARLELSAEGVRLLAHRHDVGELVPWAEVVKAEVLRSSHARLDFVTLNLHLPGRAAPVRLTHAQGNPTWSGADAEVIASFLRRHLGDSRFELTALRGPPADAAETDRRLARLDKAEQEWRKVGRLTWCVLVAGTLALTVILSEAWNRPNPLHWGRQDWTAMGMALGVAAVLLGLQGAMCLGLVYFQRRDQRRQRDEVLRWKAAPPRSYHTQNNAPVSPRANGII